MGKQIFRGHRKNPKDKKQGNKMKIAQRMTTNETTESSESSMHLSIFDAPQ